MQAYPKRKIVHRISSFRRETGGLYHRKKMVSQKYHHFFRYFLLLIDPRMETSLDALSLTVLVATRDDSTWSILLDKLLTVLDKLSAHPHLRTFTKMML